MSFETRRRGSRKLRPSFGAPEFPSPTAGLGSQRGKVTDGTDPGEVFYDCQICGFNILGSRVQSPGGTHDGDGGVRKVQQGTGVVDPRNRSGFCPFCATANSKFGNAKYRRGG